MLVALQIATDLTDAGYVRVRGGIPQLLGLSFAAVKNTRIFSHQLALNPCVIAC